MSLAVGPFTHVETSTGVRAPLYALRFDKDGTSLGPNTQQHLIGSLASGQYTDVYLFSHGWNNDWSAALTRYTQFISNITNLIKDHKLDLGRQHNPVLAGIFWPSTALVMPWEQGPQFAGAGDFYEVSGSDLALQSEIRGQINSQAVNTFNQLVDNVSLSEADAKKLAKIVEGVFSGGDSEVSGYGGPDDNDLLTAWSHLEAALAPDDALPSDPSDFGHGVGTESNVPQPASFLDKLNPRNLLRLATVRQMKDRAGTVGVRGVGPLLQAMLTRAPESTRFHLAGHSYGARVVLNAVARPQGGDENLPRSVDSMLLLQPAVNYLCFAPSLPGGGIGAYAPAIGRVRQPIMTTYSGHDFPLRRVFHLALCRKADLGEREIAGDVPPNQFAALGGYGVGEAAHTSVEIKSPTDNYDLASASGILEINGTRLISGHGDVVNEATAWALLNLVRG